VGFNIFKEAVRRMHAKYDNLRWMKLSEIARYWAAKELTRIERSAVGVRFSAPFAAPDFTIRVARNSESAPQLRVNGDVVAITEVNDSLRLSAGTFWRGTDGQDTICFNLPKGSSEIVFG
jgi:hypothetical protein